MVGDGISIDPLEGVLHAPCGGEIVHIHKSLHAVTIKTDNNIEILLHIGLDTVTLKGEGFTSKVSIGDTVSAGDELILFDMKTVALKVPHLLTQVIISTMDLVDKIDVIEPSEAKVIPTLGGEGVGLLRSEFLFLDRTTSPTEDEQFEIYKEVLESVNSNDRVVIRTLDVGGDKPLSYLPLPKEDNPFLGERGIRVGLNRPEILRTQLRALLRASIYGNLHIMFPMIGDILEFREAKEILEEERKKLNINYVPTGIMIEVPSAAILANIFAKEVDFFSVVTNDLTQYTMAMDRGHPKLAKKSDGLHPAVLSMIKLSVEAAHREGKWVGVCGGLAGDSQAVPILLGLGVDELSVSIPVIPAVKAQIRKLSMEENRKLADKALSLSTFEEVRSISPNPYSNEQV